MSLSKEEYQLLLRLVNQSINAPLGMGSVSHVAKRLVDRDNCCLIKEKLKKLLAIPRVIYLDEKECAGVEIIQLSSG